MNRCKTLILNKKMNTPRINETKDDSRIVNQ